MRKALQISAEKLARFLSAPIGLIGIVWMLGYLGACSLFIFEGSPLVRWGLAAVSLAALVIIGWWVGKEVGKEQQHSYEHAQNLLVYIRLEATRLTYARDNLIPGPDETELSLIAQTLETLERAERLLLASHPEKFADSLTRDLEAMLGRGPEQRPS